MLAEIFRKANLCFAIGPEMADEFGLRYGRKFHPFQNAINLRKFQAELETFRATKSESEPPTLLYYGSVLPFAQQDTLLLAAKAIEKSRWKLLIRTSADCAAQLGNSLQGLTRTELQVYPGDPLDFPKQLAKASALLLPANFDTASIEFLRFSMPTKIPGYMASGAPILYLGPPDIAQGQYAKDEAQFRSALESLEVDQKLRSKLTSQALACAVRSHDQETVRANFQKQLVEYAKL